MLHNDNDRNDDEDFDEKVDKHNTFVPDALLGREECSVQQDGRGCSLEGCCPGNWLWLHLDVLIYKFKLLYLEKRLSIIYVEHWSYVAGPI